MSIWRREWLPLFPADNVDSIGASTILLWPRASSSSSRWCSSRPAQPKSCAQFPHCPASSRSTAPPAANGCYAGPTVSHSGGRSCAAASPAFSRPPTRKVNSASTCVRPRVASRIEFTVTGSEFESTLTLRHASAAIFGLDEARRRLKLHTPFFLRFTAENAYPRVYSTYRPQQAGLANFYGPFPSPRRRRPRYCDAVLDLFKLAPLRQGPRALSRASRLRLRRDEQMPRSVQPGLHAGGRRRLRSRGRRRACLL